MEIKKIVSFECDENCYLLKSGNKGILIDPGFDFEKILKECEDIEIPYIFLTHCHYDHVKSCANMKREKQSKIVSSEKCSSNMKDKVINASYLFGREESYMPADIFLKDNEIFNTFLGDIRCIYTPGHTDCSVCFFINDHIFTGDTLFKLSIGRWDLATGDGGELIESIKNKIYTLDENISVHPGHGEDTEIGYEKKHNLYIRADK